MKAIVANYPLAAPRDLAEALGLLSAGGGSVRPLAGGTDLMVVLAGGRLPEGRFLSLWRLDELRGIDVTDDAVTMGALTTYTDIQAHPILQSEMPMLCQAASETGGLAIQNRGTLGGNIVNASPAADSPPALLAYGASIELVSTRGSRWVPYRTFHTGYKLTVMAKDELVARVRVPRSPHTRVHFYRKVGPRKAQAISKVCFAACVDVVNRRVASAGIAVGGVAPIVLPCAATEKALLAHALDEKLVRATLSAEIAPIDDVRSTARYRRRVAENLVDELLTRVRALVDE